MCIRDSMFSNNATFVAALDCGWLCGDFLSDLDCCGLAWGVVFWWFCLRGWAFIGLALLGEGFCSNGMGGTYLAETSSPKDVSSLPLGIQFDPKAFMLGSLRLHLGILGVDPGFPRTSRARRLQHGPCVVTCSLLMISKWLYRFRCFAYSNVRLCR